MSSPFILRQAYAQGSGPLSIEMANDAGSYLLAFARIQPGHGAPAISDTSLNTWTPIYSAGSRAAWWTKPLPTANNVISIAPSEPLTDLYAVEIADAAAIATSSADGTGLIASGTISGFGVSVPLLVSEAWAAVMAVLSSGEGDPEPICIAFVDSDSGLAAAPDNIPLAWRNVNPSSTPTYSEILQFTGIAVGAGVPIGDMILEVCLRAGLDASQVDVSLLTPANVQPSNICDGYVVHGPSSGSTILQELMRAFFVDACESGGKLKFIPRGLGSVLTIPEEDLGIAQDKAAIHEELGDENDLPLRVIVLYSDPALNLQQGKQEKIRNARFVRTRRQETLSTSLTMTGDFARQLAEKHLYLAWLERMTYALNLWKGVYMRLDPSDVIEFIFEGLVFEIRIVEMSLGQGLVVGINGVNEDARNYLSIATGAKHFGAPTPGPVQLVGNTILFLLDIPLLRDTDENPSGTGYTFAMNSKTKTWAGALLYVSSDNSSFGNRVSQSTARAGYGTALNALGAPRSPWTWDTVNTLTVDLGEDILGGDTALNVLNGANMLLVAGEVIQFANCVLNVDGTYTLSRLLRGRRGTEWACGTHAIGDTVLDPAAGFTRKQEPIQILNRLRYYRAVTAGQTVTAAGSQEFTIAGVDRKPYAPCNLGRLIDGSGNMTITWTRRTRVGGEWLDAVNMMGNVPLSEDSELYDVEILNGAAVVRSFKGLTSPACAYPAADQTTDFGAPQTEVTVNIYQVSAQVGRGYPAHATLTKPGVYIAWNPQIKYPPGTPVIVPGGPVYINPDPIIKIPPGDPGWLPLL
jgi:hypothetical protein